MLAGISMPLLALLMAGGVALDALFGEVPRWHPLVGFGRFASMLEKFFNKGRHRFLRGTVAWSLAVLLPFACASYACAMVNPVVVAVLHALLLYFCLGLRSLRDHMLPIAQALRCGEIERARELTSRIVSRDTASAEASDLSKATVESMLENGNDAVFGTLFWFAVAGGPGALLFRLANTLDAMWGYRTPRFASFGCTAARLDDLLNWVPARLTALSYACLGNAGLAWKCWRSQAPQWSSPNAGPVMASGAGALGLALGGAATYHGEVEQRPALGEGRPATAADIECAWKLVARAAALWVAIAACIGLAVFLKGH